jgi:hypothetical protein
MENRISIKAYAYLSALAGVSFHHIGTPASISAIQEKQDILSKILQVNISNKAVFTKLTPEVFDVLKETFRDNSVFMICGYLKSDNGIDIDFNNVIKFDK